MAADFTTDYVFETSATTGVGPYTLDGAVLGMRTFLTAFGTGKEVEYVTRLADHSKWERCIGILSTGPNRVTRNLVESSTGGLINWTVGDPVRYVHPIASADRLAKLRANHYGPLEPPVKQKGMIWFDSNGAPTGTLKRIWNGAGWVVEGTLDETAGIFFPSAPFNSYPTVTPASDDIVPLGDQSDSYLAKKTTLGSLARVLDLQGLSSGTPAALADLVMLGQSSDSYKPKSVTISDLPFWKLYQDSGNITNVGSYIKDAIPSSFNYLRISYTVLPATSGAFFQMIARKSSGTDITSFDFRYIRAFGTGVGETAADAQSSLNLSPSISNDATAGGGSGQILIQNIQAARHKFVINLGAYRENTPANAILFSIGKINDTAPITGLKFLCSAGNIASARIRIEGC